MNDNDDSLGHAFQPDPNPPTPLKEKDLAAALKRQYKEFIDPYIDIETAWDEGTGNLTVELILPKSYGHAAGYRFGQAIHISKECFEKNEIFRVYMDIQRLRRQIEHEAPYFLNDAELVREVRRQGRYALASHVIKEKDGHANDTN